VNGPERLHRKDPERTEPVRRWSTLYRAPEAQKPHGLPPGAEAPGAEPEREEKADSWSDVVAEGVAVGYRVIEEQIRQGQRVAEQFSEASYGPAAMSGDLREASERMVRYSADLVALWLDFVNSTVANGDLLRGLSGVLQPGGPTPRTAAEPAATTNFAVEISSTRAVRVSLELKPGSAARALAAHALRALEEDKPALADVACEGSRDGGLVTVRLRVPDGQPAGLYTGVIADRQTGEPVGTLSARLLE
jgi:hypothetical protein